MSTSDIIGWALLGVLLVPAFVYTAYCAFHAKPDDWGDHQ